jgi:hypothetical protein
MFLNGVFFFNSNEYIKLKFPISVIKVKSYYFLFLEKVKDSIAARPGIVVNIQLWFLMGDLLGLDFPEMKSNF